MPIKVADADLAAGIRWTADHAVPILNASMGFRGDATELDASAAHAQCHDPVAMLLPQAKGEL